MLDFTPGGHSGSNLLSTDFQQDCQVVQHTGKQPDYLDVLSLPAVVRLGALENAVLAAVNKAEAAGLKTRSATLLDILQAGDTSFSLHVRYCIIWHHRRNQLSRLSLLTEKKSLHHLKKVLVQRTALGGHRSTSAASNLASACACIGTHV